MLFWRSSILESCLAVWLIVIVGQSGQIWLKLNLSWTFLSDCVDCQFLVHGYDYECEEWRHRIANSKMSILLFHLNGRNGRNGRNVFQARNLMCRQQASMLSILSISWRWSWGWIWWKQHYDSLVVEGDRLCIYNWLIAYRCKPHTYSTIFIYHKRIVHDR